MLNVFDRGADLRVEYMEVVDAARMQPVNTIVGDVRFEQPWLGSTRLIDNVLVTLGEP